MFVVQFNQSLQLDESRGDERNMLEEEQQERVGMEGEGGEQTGNSDHN